MFLNEGILCTANGEIFEQHPTTILCRLVRTFSVSLERANSWLTAFSSRFTREKHLELFGEETRGHHKQFLFRRIAWRIQALAKGGLSERVKRRALEIANDADLRLRAPRTKFGQDTTIDPRLRFTRKVAGNLDARLPPPGSYLERDYRGRRVIVKVLAKGYESEGRIYRSLSAIASEVAGTKWNGFLFFNLSAEEKTNGQE